MIKSWAVTGAMLKVLDGIHHRVARKIAAMKYWRVEEGEWEWSLIEYNLEAAGLWKMKEYIWRRKDIIVEYTANQLIYEICTEAEQMALYRRFLQWWDQDLTWKEEKNGIIEGEEREVG